MYSLNDISIIIPCITVDSLTIKCISVIKDIYKKIDIIILADFYNGENINDVNLQITGHVSISTKRNLGANLTTKKILAFIDSDAYPKNCWLESSIDGFNRNMNLSCITGPNISPISSPYWEHCVGIALSSFLVTLNATHLKKPTKNEFYVNYASSVNLIVLKDLYFKYNGMNPELFGGEDLDFCTKIINGGEKILYIPTCAVFHKNRDLYGFLTQRLAYGGFTYEFISRGNKTILNFLPLLPVFFVIFLISTPFVFLYSNLFYLNIIILSFYFLLIAFETIRLKIKNIYYFPGLICILFLSTIVPGVGFIFKFFNVLPHYSKFYRNSKL